MIPIGATVRWRPDIDKRATVIGVATARRPERTGNQIEIDRRNWWVSEGLLEVVGEMAHMTDGMTEKDARDGYAESQQKIMRLLADLSAAEQERDALRELVVAQATTNAELAQQIKDMNDPLEWERLQTVHDDFGKLRASVRQHFANLFGTFDPTSMDCRAKGIDASDLIEEMARYDG